MYGTTYQQPEPHSRGQLERGRNPQELRGCAVAEQEADSGPRWHSDARGINTAPLISQLAFHLLVVLVELARSRLFEAHSILLCSKTLTNFLIRLLTRQVVSPDVQRARILRAQTPLQFPAPQARSCGVGPASCAGAVLFCPRLNRRFGCTHPTSAQPLRVQLHQHPLAHTSDIQPRDSMRNGL
ncbi:hypothetical protein B0H16DRAFT_1563578 [Mycena metata]|uniref:Uncharacterized protein n=1 Tax=Mycena metata TaxID=1033252 RepID=A0AAD7N305_9AGAR|nr:hypothetical protein B0H16DRAFT_1563578 [Mycena metata]